MRKKEKTGGGARCGFRLEWESSPEGMGRLYLFGVRSFGEYRDDRKGFLSGAGRVTVKGKGLTVRTYRSGGVELTGVIVGVDLSIPEGKDGETD